MSQLAPIAAAPRQDSESETLEDVDGGLASLAGAWWSP
jgi:hypothetical protein